jgi:medium-chain acyl-[acyl-carrier-protein] hydrolase
MKYAKQVMGFFRFQSSAEADTRLFCFPYAGGNAQVFKGLAKTMGPEIEVVGVDYPGRGTRFGEEPLHDVHQLVNDLAATILRFLDRPFAFYGHSNGALVAFELARRVSRMYCQDPQVLFLAAKRSPTLGNEMPIHDLPEKKFVAHLRTYKGTQEEVFSCPELMKVYLPILRADFALSETYQMADSLPLRVPIHALAGTEDHLASPDAVRAWKSLTKGDFTLHQINGSHFFLETHGEEISDLITKALTPWIFNSPKQRITQCF